MFGNFFKLTDKKIAKELGNELYITNGIGYGFISDNELYHNGHIEIGFGRTISGYGDWGGGFDRQSTCPLEIVIDRDYNIISSKTDSFYNSPHSKEMEWIAKKLKKKLGKKLIVENESLRKIIDSIFSVVPCKSHIGMDIKANAHPDDIEYEIKRYTAKENMSNYYSIPDANMVQSNEWLRNKIKNISK